MSPTKIDVYESGDWFPRVTIRPSDGPVLRSHNEPPEGHCIYFFVCSPDDKRTEIYRVDKPDPGEKSPQKHEKTVKSGDGHYEMRLWPDGERPQRIRIRHERK